MSDSDDDRDEDQMDLEDKSNNFSVYLGQDAGRLFQEGRELERAFVAAWITMNEKNYANGRLLDIIMGENWTVTKRDSQVAATIIQWLGTNVGMGFLRRAFTEGGLKITGSGEPVTPCVPSLPNHSTIQ